VPADKSANAVILPVGCLRDLRERRSFFPLHQLQNLLRLTAGSGGFRLGCLCDLFPFEAFAAFWLDFAFFGLAVCVVVSCVLIVFSFVLSASDDTFITPVWKECEAKDKEKRSIWKGVDDSVKSVTRRL